MGVFINTVAWFTFIFWQIYTPDEDDVKWYKKNRSKITGAPPSGLFGIAWTILYTLLVVIAVTFFESNDTFVAIYVVFIINILLNKFWTPIFFRQRALLLSIVVAVGMLGTEVALLILFGIEVAWLQFGLLFPYVIWTAYALYLNIAMYRIEKNIENTINDKYRVPLC